MSKLAKIIIGTVGVFVVALVGAFFFLHYQVVKSFPTTSGTLPLPGLHAPVEVYRDEYGVPHINARDEHDLAMATGFVQAQDRLWQMDIMRRAGQGRLSEVIGPATLDYDRLFRTVGLARIAGKIAENLHPESRELLENYAAGVNAFISESRGVFPVEFDMLRYEPEPWSVEHSVLISRLMAWELNLAWWTDLTYAQIAARVPQEKLQEILPGWGDDLPTIVQTPEAGRAASSLRAVNAIARSYRELFGLGLPEAGSNGWVIDSSRSLTGKPLLANDPHLMLPAPSRWYAMHLSAPGFNVCGVSIPGVPVIVIGRNDSLAWGLTNAMIDDADFYLEKTDTADTGAYIVGKAVHRFQEREEVIYVKGADSLVLTVRSTIHGPVINDVQPLRNAVAPAPVTMRWTGLELSDEVEAFSRMDKAHDVASFEAGLKELTVPAQAVVYADAAGNIAYWTAGRVPIRGKGNPLLLLSGSSGDAEWTGWIPFEALPRKKNPPDGMLVCANQSIAGKGYPYYLSMQWEPPSRAERIQQLLASSDKLSREDFQQFQQDVVANHARETVPHILRAIDAARSREPKLLEMRNYLRNWDYRATTSDIATTLFNVFYVHLLENIYRDEMGDTLFKSFVFSTRIAYRVTTALLEHDTSSWFDDVRTESREEKNEIILRSAADAIHELDSTLGPEMKQWRWGSLHTVEFQHLFGRRKPLDRVFNIGPHPVPGTGTTVDKTMFDFAHPYTVLVGPSMREIVDLASPDRMDLVITTGQSGQALNRHYDDQTPLWLNGGYHTVITDWKKIRDSGYERLELEPAAQ